MSKVAALLLERPSVEKGLAERLRGWLVGMGGDLELRCG